MLSGTSPARVMSCFVIADTFIRAVRAVASPDELITLMEAVTRDMGFRHYALIHHDDLREARPDRVDLKDYPAAIADRLIGQRHYRHDPIIRGCLFADSAFLWSDLHQIMMLNRKDQASFEYGSARA